MATCSVSEAEFKAAIWLIIGQDPGAYCKRDEAIEEDLAIRYHKQHENAVLFLFQTYGVVSLYSAAIDSVVSPYHIRYFRATQFTS